MTAGAAALCVALGVALVLLPDGWWARAALHRTRHEPRRRWSAQPGPSGPPRRWARVPGVLRRGPVAVGRLLRSGCRRRADPVADRQVGVALIVAVVTAVVVSPVVAVPAGLGAWALPVVRARARRRTEERRVRTALPDVVDLFRLAVGSGLSLHQAIDAVAVRSPAPVDAVLDEVRRRVGLGVRLGDALDALDPLGDAVLPLASALRGAARYGAPLGASLERVAVDARILRRRRAEEDARRLPVQLLFPLVLCVLPAFGLLAVVPLLLASLRSLQL